MLQINCPWCGARAETEFTCGGEGGIVRPTATETMTDEQWGDYVFMRKNPKGVHLERWVHRLGCRRWFNMARNTVTHVILAVYKMGEPPPPEIAAATKVTKSESRPA